MLSWMSSGSRFAVLFDGLSVPVALVAGVTGGLILVYSAGYMRHEQGKPRYYALVLTVIGSMAGFALSGNLLSMYLLWEACGLSSFALVGFRRDPRAKEAAKRALGITGIGDVALLAGFVVLHVSSTPRTFNVLVLIERARTGAIPPAALGFAAYAVLLGAIGRSAQVPLHGWLPDAMEAPTSASALVDAATTLNAGVYLVARMYPAFAGVAGWLLAVRWVGAITLAMSAFRALLARDLKKMLAYSTMSQLGYMFLALGTGAVLASQFHMVSHAIFKALLFLSAGAVIHEAHTRDMGLLSGVGHKMPVTGRMFLMGVMGLSAVPFTSGFFSKDMILAGALEAGAYSALALAVLGAALTFTYSWRAYLDVFTGEPSEALAEATEAHPSMLWPMGFLGVGTLTSWLLIGAMSAKMRDTVMGVEATAITPAHLVVETFTGLAVALSVIALGAGCVLLALGRRRP